jgi:hypothetical protein
MKSNFPQISVSILNSDLSELTKTLKLLEKEKIKYIHLDVMDGHFVPNLTFGPSVIKSIRLKTKCVLDTHLMIDSPQDKIKQYLKDLILKYKEYNQQNILNNPSIYCSLEKHFPEFKISILSMEKCKETFPTNLTLHRKIIYKKAIPIYSNPLFDNSLYIPVPRF